MAKAPGQTIPRPATPSKPALGELLQVADSAPADELTEVFQDMFSEAVRGVVLYLGDYEGTTLHPAPGSRSSTGTARAVAVDGTPAGRALRERRLVEQGEGPYRLWAPVLQRGDPIGVLELEVDETDDHLRTLAVDAGILIGHLLITARRHTDVYELHRRSRDMNLAAEMHWDILPATTYVGPSVSVAGDLEPAYEVGGDAFDYCINGRTLYVSIIDAMGHGLEAALLSTQAVAAYRYARRRGVRLAETVMTIEDALQRQFGGDRFVTGVLLQLDLENGTLSWVSSGHVLPLLIRDGKVSELDQAAVLCPMGLNLIDDIEGADLVLRPGDRILLYSDGVIEARAPNGEYLELSRLIELIQAADHEEGIDKLVKGLIDQVIAHSQGPLRDDATILGFEYSAAPVPA